MGDLRFKIKKGDRKPPLQIQVFNPDKTPRDLSDLAGITFYMGKQGEAPVVAAGTVVGVLLSEGIVEYQWQAGNTSTPGEYRAEFILVDNDGFEETFPKDTYIIVEVTQDVT